MVSPVTVADRAVLIDLYRGFNWPNGMQGGRVYWRRQGTLIDPWVEPKEFCCDEAGRAVVGVHQLVRERSAAIAWRRYAIEDGLIRRMDSA